MLIVVAMAARGPLEALAQPATGEAEILFREGKTLMGQGNITAACDAFEGSYAKEPAVSTLVNLADCREKNQQYASAWAHFVEAARTSRTMAGYEALTHTAETRAAALEPRLSYLTISVPDDTRVPGLEITRNGTDVEAFEWNRAMPVDGGTYQIVAKAPAHEPWSATVAVANAADHQTVTVPRFADASTMTSAAVPPSHLEATRNHGQRMAGRRKLALGAGVLGLAAAGASVWFEVASRSTYDDAEAVVDMDEGRSRELTDQANHQQHLAIGLGAAGVLTLGAATYLWLTGGRERAPASVSVDVRASRASVSFAGTF